MAIYLRGWAWAVGMLKISSFFYLTDLGHKNHIEVKKGKNI
jgi:hypothetical protein